MIVIEILACRDCGRHVLAVGDGGGGSTRITRHKCSGSWTTKETFALSGPEATDMIEEMQHLAGSDGGVA